LYNSIRSDSTFWGSRGCDRKVGGYAITYAISAYHH